MYFIQIDDSIFCKQVQARFHRRQYEKWNVKSYECKLFKTCNSNNVGFFKFQRIFLPAERHVLD